MVKDNVEYTGVDNPDEDGFDPYNEGFSGVKDWTELPEPYSSEYEFIFQEVENTDNPGQRLFKLVKTPDTHSDLQDKIYDMKSRNQFTQKHDEGTSVMWVHLNGMVDDWSPVGKTIGGDFNESGGVVHSKLNDFKTVDGKNEIDNFE